jgi:hypothetical protein
MGGRSSFWGPPLRSFLQPSHHWRKGGYREGFLEEVREELDRERAGGAL